MSIKDEKGQSNSGLWFVREAPRELLILRVPPRWQNSDLVGVVDSVNTDLFLEAGEGLEEDTSFEHYFHRT